MKIIRQATLTAWMILSALFSNAQQDVFNLQKINPAYVGSWKTIGLMGSTRQQMVGINGHPSEYAFSFQAPIDSINSGIGLSILKLYTGFEKRLSIYLDYSYRISISDQISLRFGIKGGFTNYKNNLTKYQQYPDRIPDPEFESEINVTYLSHIGMGLYLSSPKYFISLSLPEITEPEFKVTTLNEDRNVHISLNKNSNLFFAGGMILPLSDFVKFKPTFLVQSAIGDPFRYELSANILLAEKVWLGGMLESNDNFGTMAQWIIGKRFRIGYRYDFYYISELKKFLFGNHGVMLSYEIPTSKLNTISSRYF